MKPKFDFADLFVLDMANNHQGSVDHGKRIIREMGAVAHEHGLKAALKFQYRQLDTFIHRHYRDNKDVPHLSRFMSTRLRPDQYAELVAEVRAQGMLAMCTPFDEESVDIIVEQGFDLVKVASCSALDWPLLEKVAACGLPVVASTGGTTIEDIDNLVSFFRHRGVHFALMHCVSIYPIPDAYMQLNVIDQLRARYRDVTVGWSTHEPPDDITVVAMAVAKGARMFERHVGAEVEGVTLNSYSSTRSQIDAWVVSCRRAVVLCGPSEKMLPPEAETASINSLRRGVFAREPIPAGQEISREMVYFAMPYTEGQLASGQWQNGIIAREDIAPDAPLNQTSIQVSSNESERVLKQAVHKVNAMLNEARIALNSDFEVEYSHHYGMSNFMETGAVIITCVNRTYAKKLIVQLAGQYHPRHFHKRKEETFQVLAGVLQAEIDGHKRILHPGETCLIQPGVWHSFWTETGVIFEEISTRHYNDDSFYEDKAISKMERSERKTVVDHWGRFQLRRESRE